MRDDKPISSYWRYTVAAILVLAVIVAAIGTVIPLKSHSFHSCPYCRTSIERDWILRVPIRTRFHESRFTAFYRREVEARHTHVWSGGGCGTDTYTTGVRYGDMMSPMISWIDQDMLMSILRSFPSRTKRKAFIDKYCGPETDILFDRMHHAEEPLKKAYKADPKRKDWPRILKQLGLWP